MNVHWGWSFSTALPPCIAERLCLSEPDIQLRRLRLLNEAQPHISEGVRGKAEPFRTDGGIAD